MSIFQALNKCSRFPRVSLRAMYSVEGVMAYSDTVITMFKFCIIAVFWVAHGSGLSALLWYGLVVALPLTSEALLHRTFGEKKAAKAIVEANL